MMYTTLLIILILGYKSIVFIHFIYTSTAIKIPIVSRKHHPYKKFTEQFNSKTNLQLQEISYMA